MSKIFPPTFHDIMSTFKLIIYSIIYEKFWLKCKEISVILKLFEPMIRRRFSFTGSVQLGTRPGIDALSDN